MHLLSGNRVCGEFFHEVGCRKALDGGDDLDSSTCSDDVFVADDGLDGVVAAFNQNIGLQGADEFKRRVFLEEDNSIDGGKSGHDTSTFALGHDRTRWAFEATDRSVGVQPQYKLRAKTAAFLEQRDVADVQEVEAAVGEDDGFARSAPLGD